MKKFSAWIGCVVLAAFSAIVLTTSASADDYVPPPVPSTSIVVIPSERGLPTTECDSVSGGSGSNGSGSNGSGSNGSGSNGSGSEGSESTCAPATVAVQGVTRGGDLASTGVGSNVAVLAVVGFGVLLIGGALTFFGARMARRPKLH